MQDNWEEKFDEEFGWLTCTDRITKCSCSEDEHELRQNIPDYNQYDILNTIELYYNSQFASGNLDSLGREKPFFNINKFRVWEEKFDEEFGWLTCTDRITKCSCSEDEHELRQNIPAIKEFIKSLLDNQK